MFNEEIILADNSLIKKVPELFYEWDFLKNGELGLDVYKISKGSEKEVWWICPTCRSNYDMIPNNRSKGYSCPYCVGRRVNETNSLFSLHPELSKQWHPTKNANLTPHDVTVASGQKVWWLGKCVHEWEALIHSRSISNTQCPYCTNQKVLIGFNDMWTTNPELASMLAYPEDGYKYTQSSSKKVDWKCLECDNHIKSKHIYSVLTNHISCPRCSDGVSFPERFIYNLLKSMSVDFLYDTSFEWSEGRRYDFYLPEYNTIIEVHGIQHYRESLRSPSARTLEEERLNDKTKKGLALNNNIEIYITLDARESSVNWMKESVLSSNLPMNLKDVNFVEVGKMSSHSFVREACILWSSGLDILEITKIMILNDTTVRKYLNKGKEIGWCNYTPSKAYERRSQKGKVRKGIPVVQFTPHGDFIKSWNSIKEASSIATASGITMCCKGKRDLTGGYMWMYKKDYILMKEKGLTAHEYKNT